MIIKCNDCFQDYDSENAVCPHCGYVPGSDHRELNHLPAGTVLQNRYIIGRICGFGGFGVTYKAFDTQLEHIVAIKEYFPNGTVNRVPGTENVVLFTGNRLKEYRYGLQRFLDEARMTARYVSHKNIVNVFDYFEANKTAYIVMEYLDGIDLAQFLETSTGGTEKLSVEQTVDIALNVCNALKEIHKDGVIHRDISPDNIFLCLNDTIKIYDFGAARFSIDKDKLLTVILKPGYAPVEQYVEQDAKVSNQGPWTDIYALGATIYKMLTGVKPVESMNRKIRDDLKPPKELEPSVPQYLNDAVMRAMAVEPHLRFQTVGEFEAVLKQEKAVVTVDETIRLRKRKRLRGIAAASAAVLVGAGVFAAGWFRQRKANTLPPVSVQVWYRASETALGKALGEIGDVFCENNEGVGIELLAIPDAEYQAKLTEADRAQQMPVLFQSDGVDISVLSTAPLEPVLERTDLSGVWFLEERREQLLAEKRIPLGFDMPVFYLNTARCGYDGESPAQLSALTEGGTAAVAEEQRAQFAALSGSEGCTQTDPAAFYAGEADLMFADTAVCFAVREALPGQYRIVGADGASCRFVNSWSLGSTQNADEAKVAQWFLAYLLSDNAQDYCYIRNTVPGLPLNRTALDVYRDVYRNDMEQLLSDPAACQFASE